MTAKQNGIRALVQNQLGATAHQAWMAGRLDAATESLEAVYEDAKQNLERNPRHKATIKAAADLETAIKKVRGVTDVLARVAMGEPL